MTVYQWFPILSGALGFFITWTCLWFGAGRLDEQVKAEFKKEIESEREKIVSKLDELEQRFFDEQKAQDHNFGEVGAAMRQYIADVEKKLREVEIWGRDNFVQKSEFEKATDRLEGAIKSLGAEIKADLKEMRADLSRN